MMIFRNIGLLVTGMFCCLHCGSGPGGWIEQPVPAGYEKSVFRDVYFADADNGIVMGKDCLRTTDGCRSWKVERMACLTLKIFFPHPRIGIAVGRNGEILRTIDGGKNWIKIQVKGVRTELRGVHCPGRDVGIVVGRFGTILRTEDGGNTWSSQYCGTYEDLDGTWFTSRITGWVVGQFAGVIKTMDGGKTWRKLDVKPNQFGAVIFFDEMNGLLGGVNTILRTKDGGETWQESEVSISNEFIAGNYIIRRFSFCDPKNGFAIAMGSPVVGSPCQILRTRDGGKTWKSQNSDTPDLLSGIFCINPQMAVAVGEEGAIFRTTNGGWGD